jgi:hypothetical protein
VVAEHDYQVGEVNPCQSGHGSPACPPSVSLGGAGLGAKGSVEKPKGLLLGGEGECQRRSVPRRLAEVL